MKQKILLILWLIAPLGNALSQNKKLSYSNKINLVAGLSQPFFLKGVNLAMSFTTNRLLFEYSHGMNLDYTDVLNSDYKRNVLSIRSPYSTGMGFGFRFFSNKIIGMDIRAEAKIHAYEVQLSTKHFTQYTNYDLGGGIYWQIHPFGNKTKALAGIVLEPSIRYWANVSTSLNDNYTYKTNDGRTLIHKPYPLNLFANISLGYTF